ncbi:hypothetical protein [Paraburkholderia fungorum]|uniref:hypothetical protein n=1 Tax=Paraburkholderia fungorum TaxID=134537 RepID=UPI0038BD2FD5
MTIHLLPAFHFLSNNRRLFTSFTHSQTFHNYFLKDLETASATTKLDADMRKNMHLATAIFVAVATFALSGCGADDSAPASSSPTVTNNNAMQNAATSPPTGGLNTSVPLAADPAAASDSITQNMQASLAADNQQVAPVMHYAPGDSGSSN